MELPFQIDLKDKVIVVTGAGGVICGTFAKALGQCGAKIAVLDRNEERAATVAKEINSNGGVAISVVTDVLDIESLKNAKSVVNEKFGTCDVLLNGAGGNNPKGTTSKEYLSKEDLENKKEGETTFFDLDPKGIEFVFNLNFLGTLLPTQVFATDMIDKKDAAIVNISSMNAFTPLTKIPAYSGAKAAVSNFTQWLAVHFSKVGIRVNAIAPGFLITNQNKALLLNEDGSYTERSKKILNATPMDRFGECEELLGTLLWLIDSKASSFVNGVVIPVDGGFSAYSGV
ncbi:dehydrogenase [Clostridium pasteurianum DSM 525 = ATCC 6013]|uniref:3-oxoacyl-(Acyl-carrier-protein) reductase n=1 Tax=Clostridium pasteurianum DSM 525 = ATCC 6013 TaxID=1262449 RepID=A0A0H3J6G0_CLOPA|nr:SDR family oxidoreductase [Clostridium pasteurianum]AJA48772.1 dehydrogenase [Clostridium pasteurianum DSM 525 = ATCC 6013]AJA52760.1 dehydrogenase [Clostridium pasteurianum DSM 525 = ATCC 6013]AOZ75994.1 D-mannonate oxidoreductase [Clostridium pasteurianum DSM 525 = ATCC 6013]AOZ79790.1 D-mannonate oxidoreductase [Clostridium pasteurianum]ELP60070.1 D-mannonate oxidoreductase [Clostridium pasteurianum DSM 525 = ATCC 6013]